MIIMNQVILVGRLTGTPRRDEYDNGMITIAVARSYKNADGVYETDFIPCKLWGNMCETTLEYCKVGDILGVKGRLQTDGPNVIVAAEKITFLSAKSSNERDDD